MQRLIHASSTHPQVQQNLLCGSTHALHHQRVLPRGQLSGRHPQEALSDCIIVVHNLAVVCAVFLVVQAPAEAAAWDAAVAVTCLLQ
jgi:hypothetical protein